MNEQKLYICNIGISITSKCTESQNFKANSSIILEKYEELFNGGKQLVII